MQDNQKITTLHKEYTKEKTLANIRELKRKRLVRMRKTAITVLGCLAILLTSWPLFSNHRRANQYKEQYQAAQKQLHQLKDEKEDLDYQVTLLENEDYIAKLARSEYHLTKDDEMVFRLPKKAKDKKTQKQAKQKANKKTKNE